MWNIFMWTQFRAKFTLTVKPDLRETNSSLVRLNLLKYCYHKGSGLQWCITLSPKTIPNIGLLFLTCLWKQQPPFPNLLRGLSLNGRSASKKGKGFCYSENLWTRIYARLYWDQFKGRGRPGQCRYAGTLHRLDSEIALSSSSHRWLIDP